MGVRGGLLRAAYALIWSIVILLGWPTLLFWKKLRGRGLQRFGWHDAATTRQLLQRRSGIWIHAASAGDVRTVAPIVNRLPEDLRQRLVLSCTSDSGFASAAQLFPDLPCVALPLDHPLPCWRVLHKLRPKVLIMEYREIWPELLLQAQRSGSMIVLTNASMSAHSFQRYQQLRHLFGGIWRQLTHVFAREQRHAAHFSSLGVPAARITVAGSSKYDAVCDGWEASKQGERSIDILFGSVHRDEFPLVAETVSMLRQQNHRVRITVAPRYLEHTEQLLALLPGTATRRSAGSGGDDALVVLDTMGELSSAYGQAKIAVVGGSFGERGGQNPLEPAIKGLPILFGPNMANFTADASWLLEAGAMEVKTPGEICDVTWKLLGDPAQRARLGDANRAGVLARTGASELIAKQLTEVLR